VDVDLVVDFVFVVQVLVLVLLLDQEPLRAWTA
jgi:hypothetical protein